MCRHIDIENRKSVTLPPLLEFKNANFKFERECRSVVKREMGSTTGCKMSIDVADSAIMIFRIINSNVSSKLSTFHSNVSDFLAVVAKDGTGPNAIGRIVSCLLTMIAKTRVGHRLGSVKLSNVLRHYGGG